MSDSWPGLVYVLCCDPPRVIDSVSPDYPHDPDTYGREATVGNSTGRAFGYRSLPIRHYVGWTSHRDPYTRLRWHGLRPPFAEVLVSKQPGTLADEQRMKDTGRCARCGGSLKPGES
jgi:hypothetical protein